MKKLTTQEFIEKARKVHQNKYDYSKVEYINNHTKICIICPEHGEFWQQANSHLDGHGCKECGHIKKGLSKRFSTKDFILKASKIHNNKYDYSQTVYTKSDNKVIVVCPIHGPFEQIANHHLRGSGCPKCNSGFLGEGIASKGETIIEVLLKQYDINFVPQFEVNIDQNINQSGKAYIDFYLPDLSVAIEYNGIQHYTPRKFFGGEIAFNKQVLRDEYIRKYCLNNDIKLIELSYQLSKEEIENIIKLLK